MKDKKVTEKREVRTYKVADKYYFKAQKRAAKEKTTVGNVVEETIKLYAEGFPYLSSKL